jgi:hypothetical protein
MKWRIVLALLALNVFAAPRAFTQTPKPLANADIVNMTEQGLDSNLIVKEIQSSGTDFDTAPQTLIDLKNAGVDNSVIDAMLSAVPPSRALERRTILPSRFAPRTTVACSRKASKFP